MPVVDYLRETTMINAPKLNTAAKEAIENTLNSDALISEAIFKRRICLGDVVLSTKNRHLLKRLFDISIALIALAVAGPLMLMTALLIKLTSPGPVFFKQQRVGLMGKIFIMYKFRTMAVETDSSIHRDYVRDLFSSERPMIKIDDCHRLIPFGKIIRRLFIDELPQLFNVLQGQMSLVGPRPAIPYEVHAYQDWHMKRLLAMPGMTGLWQVSGKNRLTFDEMVRLDIQYVRQCSVLQDIKILIMTPYAIFCEIRNKQNQ